MITLDRRSRLMLLTLSIGSFAAAIALTPLDARSASPLTDASEPIPRGAPRLAPIVSIEPLRDPFAEDRPLPTTSAAPSPPAALPFAFLPPNLPEPNPLLAPATIDPAAAERLSAVVVGRQPFAVVERGTDTSIVSLGASLDGSTIAGIDLGGVRLADGRTIRFSPKRNVIP